ncbi:MAG: hypothetical protein M1826_005724 [Phylliscum demangeonii]|nr:MAG: hypothetical protein M1826_005724 [Phylliscum demangeonii]
MPTKRLVHLLALSVCASTATAVAAAQNAPAITATAVPGSQALAGLPAAIAFHPGSADERALPRGLVHDNPPSFAWDPIYSPSTSPGQVLPTALITASRAASTATRSTPENRTTSSAVQAAPSLVAASPSALPSNIPNVSASPTPISSNMASARTSRIATAIAGAGAAALLSSCILLL